MNRYSKWFLMATVLVFMTGCMTHVGHRSGFHSGHSNVRIHGHFHGKPSHVIGGLIAGALITQIIHEAAEQHHSPEQHQERPRNNYYLKTLAGECLWVQVDRSGVENRTQVDLEYCEN